MVIFASLGVWKHQADPVSFSQCKKDDVATCYLGTSYGETLDFHWNCVPGLGIAVNLSGPQNGWPAGTSASFRL